MKRFMICCMVLAISLGGTSSFCQDYGQLLEAVNKLELSLKNIVIAESDARAEQFSDLQKQIDALSKSRANNQEIVKINAELSKLKKQNIALVAENEKNSLPNEQLIELLNEIELSKAEIMHLKDMMNKNQNLFVSLEGGALPQETQTDTRYDKLNDQIEDLSVRLNNAINSQATQNQETLVPTSGINFSGFVDASNYSDFNQGENSFGLDQVEIDFIKEFSDQTSLRADIEYVSDGMGNFDMDLEQGYFTYNIGQQQSWSFVFGKFNAPIGFELLDAPDMFQYSHSLVFNLGLPTNLTGMMVTTYFSSSVDWTVYIVNGWDVNTDNNKEKTIGTRLGFSPVENLNIGFSIISGAELDDNNSSRRTVIDWDLTYNPQPYWTIGWEYNYGTETKVLTDDASGNWSGLLLMNNFAIGERFGITGRFDYFKDEDGLRTGTPQTLTAFAISPSFAIVDGLGGLFEIRYDISDEDVFSDSDGNPKDNNVSTALEFTYGF